MSSLVKQYIGEIPDYRARYELLIGTIDSEPFAKKDLEKILFTDQHEADTSGMTELQAARSRANALAYEAEDSTKARRIFELKLDERFGEPQDLVKAYVAYGRMQPWSGWQLGRNIAYVSRRRRFEGNPTLQKIANAIMIVPDYIAQLTKWLDRDWLRLLAYVACKPTLMKKTED